MSALERVEQAQKDLGRLLEIRDRAMEVYRALGGSYNFHPACIAFAKDKNTGAGRKIEPPIARCVGEKEERFVYA